MIRKRRSLISTAPSSNAPSSDDDHRTTGAEGSISPGETEEHGSEPPAEVPDAQPPTEVPDAQPPPTEVPDVQPPTEVPDVQPPAEVPEPPAEVPDVPEPAPRVPEAPPPPLPESFPEPPAADLFATPGPESGSRDEAWFLKTGSPAPERAPEADEVQVQVVPRAQGAPWMPVLAVVLLGLGFALMLVLYLVLS